MNAQHDEDDLSVWAAAMQHLADAGDRLAALMAERDEPAGRTDGFVALLGATMDTYLNQVCADPDFPTFVPCCGYYQRLGSPNPDTVYRRAPVDPAGTYRITGELGTARQVTLMPFTARMGSSEPFDLADLTIGPDGRFDVLVGPVRPADHTGDWWPLASDTASLWLRVVSDDWGNEREPRVAIRRVDGPRRRPRPAPEPIEAKLAVLGRDRGAHHLLRRAPHRRAHRRRLRQPDEAGRLRAAGRDAVAVVPRRRLRARRGRRTPPRGHDAAGLRLLLVLAHRPHVRHPRLGARAHHAQPSPGRRPTTTACCASSSPTTTPGSGTGWTPPVTGGASCSSASSGRSTPPR